MEGKTVYIIGNDTAGMTAVAEALISTKTQIHIAVINNEIECTKIPELPKVKPLLKMPLSLLKPLTRRERRKQVRLNKN